MIILNLEIKSSERIDKQQSKLNKLGEINSRKPQWNIVEKVSTPNDEVLFRVYIKRVR